MRRKAELRTESSENGTTAHHLPAGRQGSEYLTDR